MKTLTLLTNLFAATVAVAVSFTLPALAADNYKFKLHNKSSQYVINSFRTFENGQWSKNWIDFTLKPGEVSDMDWGSNDGSCVVPFRVGWVGYETDQFSVDWCKVKNIYMKDEGFSFD